MGIFERLLLHEHGTFAVPLSHRTSTLPCLDASTCIPDLSSLCSFYRPGLEGEILSEYRDAFVVQREG